MSTNPYRYQLKITLFLSIPNPTLQSNTNNIRIHRNSTRIPDVHHFRDNPFLVFRVSAACLSRQLFAFFHNLLPLK